MSLLAPHAACPRVSTMARLVPRVGLVWDVFRKTNALLDCGESQELSWIGTVDVTRIGEAELYLITDILPLRQISSRSQTVLDAEALGVVIDQWIAEHPTEKIPWKFWGHVHPFSSTTASDVDTAQMERFIAGQWTPEFFLRGIFSSRPTHGQATRRAEFTLFHYGKGVQIDDLPWDVMDMEETGRAAAQLEKVVIPEAPVVPYSTTWTAPSAKPDGTAGSRTYERLFLPPGEQQPPEAAEAVDSVLDGDGERPWILCCPSPVDWPASARKEFV